MRAADVSNRPASTEVRVAASVIDGTVVSVGLLLLLLPVGAVVGSDDPLWIAANAVWLVSLVYEVGLTARFGQTLGKRALGIMVVANDNSLPSLGQSALRYLVKSLLPLTLIANLVERSVTFVNAAFTIALLLSIARDPYRRGWHDHAAGTFVLEGKGRLSLGTRIRSTSDDADRTIAMQPTPGRKRRRRRTT